MYYSREVSLKSVPNKIGYGLNESDLIGLNCVNTNTGIERINQSLRAILSTPLGSRFFMPSFGSKIIEVLYEPNDFIFRDLVSYYTKDAISKWENRIEVLDVSVDVRGMVCFISISYKVKESGDIENFVYSLNRDIQVMG